MSFEFMIWQVAIAGFSVGFAIATVIYVWMGRKEEESRTPGGHVHLPSVRGRTLGGGKTTTGLS